ncbi:toxin-antitoxin system YwqK family antitoxin [Pontibacter akesuensis]|uniref:toxin-antitoxin system YwqK family antitoxin n=1 Tax=Pontibacter akesuensis TaxID=388950 RepID=UPI00083B4FE9|nr:hypothetical protein [Pontibacter akesuensis]
MKHLVYTLVAGMFLLMLGGCGQPKWNSDYNLDKAQLKGRGATATDALAAADTTMPTVEKRNPLEEEIAEKAKKKRKKKRSKKEFLGYKVKRAYTKTGGRSRETVEFFSYLPVHEEPDPYAPFKYYYDTKNKKLARSGSNVEDTNRYKVLHGPYKKTLNDEVVEEGYFYIGTKHLRWEKYRDNEDHTLLDKEHYEKGFLRDAVVTYYGDTKKIKEVIPYEFGEVQGTYYRFYENGQLEWSGQYQKGRKVGVWINYYDFRNRRHYEFQYPKTAYEPQAEPILIKEYDRHATPIFELGKFDKREQARTNQ